MELDAGDIAPRSHVDDEYARAGTTDPKILITTSRDPSSRLGQFAKVQLPANARARARDRPARGT